MSTGQKIVVISVSCIIVFAVIAVGLYFLINSILPKTYSSAKKECEIVLDKYQVQMEEIAVDSLKLGKNVSGEFKEHYFSCYIEEGLVSFDIDAQGFLGGQYWELVYTQDGKFYGETESYLHEETNGNNIVRAEKINEHWWYLWTDYDGTDRSYK